MARKKRDKFFWFLFALSLFLIVFSLYLFFSKPKPLQVNELDVEFEVVEGQRVGFDVNNSLLVFGRIPPGNGGTRWVEVFNDYDFPIEVRSLVSENLADLIYVNRTVFIDVGENVTIPFVLDVPQDFELGEHVGKVRIEIYKSE